MATYAFISDIHFGMQSAELERVKLAHVRDVFRALPDDLARLYVNGDYFDWGFGYRRVMPVHLLRPLQLLSEVQERGIPITFIAGNHDHWALGLLREELGMEVFEDPITVELNGLRVRIGHGDGLARSDRGYRMLKWVMRNRAAIAGFRMIPPDWGVALTRTTSRLSRDYTTSQISRLTEEYADVAQAWIERERIDLVIFGHDHYPMHRLYPRADGSVGAYVNLGEFYAAFTYGWLDGPRFELRRFNKPGEPILARTFDPARRLWPKAGAPSA